MSSEWTRIDLLRRALTGPADPRVLLAIGDDAAVLVPGIDALIWTIDAAVEGVHFRRDLLSFEDIGYRSTMAAASDLAAMGAEPRGLLAALVIPADIDDTALDAIARGQRAAADALGTSVIGGNLARGGELSITTTVLGAAPHPLTRSGARSGDVIWMAGPVGLAAAGLATLLAGGDVASDAARAAVAAWRRPVARIDDGVRVRARAHAAIDVSDGLAQDVGHMARASGLRAVLEEGAFVGAELRQASGAIGMDALELALHGGEDYALVVALAPGEGAEGFLRIGRFEPREGASDVALARADGSLAVITAAGFDHFRTPLP